MVPNVPRNDPVQPDEPAESASPLFGDGLLDGDSFSAVIEHPDPAQSSTDTPGAQMR
jgi:hypothetical protein